MPIPQHVYRTTGLALEIGSARPPDDVIHFCVVYPLLDRQEIVQTIRPGPPKRPACHILVDKDSAVGDVLRRGPNHIGMV